MSQVDVQMPSEDEDFDITTQFDSGKTVETEENNEPVSDTPAGSSDEGQDQTHDNHGDDDKNDDTPAEENNEPSEPEEIPERAAPPPPTVTRTSPPATQAFRPREPVSSNIGPQQRLRTAAPTVTAQPVVGLKPKRFSKHYIFEGILGIAVIILALTTWSLYSDRQDLNQQVASMKANPQAIIAQQTQDLINTVGKLMQLPSGETPTVAVVSNVAAARQQSTFFDKAQNGDKLLLYPKAGEAILYRPSTNKVVIVGPLTLTNSSSSTGTTSGTTTP